MALSSTVWVLTRGTTGMRAMKCCLGKEKVVSELKQLAEKADHIYLATDLDREGKPLRMAPAEVIGGDDTRYSRVVFNEITKMLFAGRLKNRAS